MAFSPLIGAFLAGLLGGGHCLAMCGGFLSAFSGAGRTGSARLLPARTLAVRQLPYNLGRIATYTLLGGLIGGLGGLALGRVDWLSVQRALFVVANLFLLSLALGLVWQHDGVGVLQRAGGAIFARAAPIVAPLAAMDGILSRFALGMVWGLVPCALIYAMLPIALFAGDAGQGAAVMLAFGLGTLPNLVAAGWVLARARRWLDGRWIRYGAASLLAAFAAIGIWRALFGPMSMAHGPFCLILG